MKRILFIVIFVPISLIGNQSPIIESFTSSSYSIMPLQTVDLELLAHDPDCQSTCTSGCGQYIRADLTSFSADGGNFLTINYGSSASPYSASATWQAPETEGTYTITVQIGDSGSFICGGRLYSSASIQINVSSNLNNPPVINSIIPSQNPVFISTAINLLVDAQDPENDPLTFEYSTDIGEIHPISLGYAEFVAPANPGIAHILCKVSDDKGAFSTKTINIYITSVFPEKSIKLGSPEIYKISSDNYGYFYVPENRKFLAIYKASSGEFLKRLAVNSIYSVCVDWNDNLLVGTKNSIKVISKDGEVLLNFNTPPNFDDITDTFCAFENQKYLALSSSQGKVFIFDKFGSYERSFGGTGDGIGEFKKASGIYSFGNEIYVGDVGHGMVKVFDFNGNYLRSYGKRGGKDGEFVSINSIAVDLDGNIYIVDTFKSTTTVFSQDGFLREIFGKYGENLGELVQPTSISLNLNTGKIYIANPGKGSIEIYKLNYVTDPPQNNPPSVPEPIAPLSGDSFPKGTNIFLSTRKSIDPDFQNLIYNFELYEKKPNKSNLIATWNIEGMGDVISVDSSPFLKNVGDYFWRVRAYDTFVWSPWCNEQNFRISEGNPNNPPTIPAQIEPIGGIEVTTLEPSLRIYNSSDKDGNNLFYDFEVYTHYGTKNYALIYKAEKVPQGEGITEIKIPPLILGFSQEVFWRARAFDGYVYSDFSPLQNFITPPFDFPLKDSVGNFSEGDMTRPYFVNFKTNIKDEDLKIYFQTLGNFEEADIQIEVNNNYLHNLPAFDLEYWSFTQEILIPKEELSNEENRIKFKVNTNKEWGIRYVTLNAPEKINLSAYGYNTIVDLVFGNYNFKNGDRMIIYKTLNPSIGFNFYFEVEPSLNLVRDIGLQNGITYYYLAIVKDLDGFESMPSDIVSATPISSNPSPITDLKLIKDGNDIILKWTGITNDIPLQYLEIYKDNFTNFIPDTNNFTNLYTTLNPQTNEFRDYNELLDPNFIWYLIYPLDIEGRRALK